MSASLKFTNALLFEQSPYLLQHAHNPVNWIAWSADLFSIAKLQDKPILLSIGYAACHWCHVMERESFEDEIVANFMNEHFINVKVDREERPDVDHVYMDALQAMTGAGGWPLNIFLLPNGKPFFGGTYFQPQSLPQRASWIDVLKGVQLAYVSNKEQLIDQAEQLTNHLVKANIKGITNSYDEAAHPNLEEFNLMTKRILHNADLEWGGFGKSPKFPQTFSIQVLLRNYFANKDQAALEHAIRSLDKMIQGGLYDHLGGGFARYSTDEQWQVPHFEKMLYDNALLIIVLSEAFQITNKWVYKKVIEETIEFVMKELSNQDGAFYAAIDADSEGVEGKFYTWTYAELQTILPANLFESFCQYFQIIEGGNWEHTNIIWTTNSIENAWTEELMSAKNILYKERAKRARPKTDHKIILSWNALMITALCKAFASCHENTYLERAEQLMSWLEIHFQSSQEYLYHSYTNGVTKSNAFLEDYASLINAYIELHKVSTNTRYLLKAKYWMQYVQQHFIDEEGVFFYFTSDEQKQGIVRQKDSYDGATPSSNAMICASLIYLGNIFDEPKWLDQATKMLGSIHPMLIQYPNSFGYWALSFFQLANGVTQLIGLGQTIYYTISPMISRFLPHVLPLWLEKENPLFPLSLGKKNVDNQYFMCKNNTCYQPSSQLEGILAII